MKTAKKRRWSMSLVSPLGKQYYKRKPCRRFAKKNLGVIRDIFPFWSTFTWLRRVIDKSKISVISAWCALSFHECHSDNLKGSGTYKDHFVSPICPNNSRVSSILEAFAKTAIRGFIYLFWHIYVHDSNTIDYELSIKVSPSQSPAAKTNLVLFETGKWTVTMRFLTEN